MAKLQSSEIVGVANRPATICVNTVCLWFDTTNLKPMASYCALLGIWSADGALATARYNLAGAGTQNAGLAFGGGLYYACNNTEEYNGTSWLAGGALITARQRLAGAGTQNAGLAIGGGYFSACNNTEEYNGTSWAVGGVLITARSFLAGAGTQNEGLAFGGYSSYMGVSCTEEYNGTSWSAGGALITARQRLAGAGTQNAGLAFGGGLYSACNNTEEYSKTLLIVDCYL